MCGSTSTPATISRTSETGTAAEDLDAAPQRGLERELAGHRARGQLGDLVLDADRAGDLGQDLLARDRAVEVEQELLDDAAAARRARARARSRVAGRQHPVTAKTSGHRA